MAARRATLGVAGRLLRASSPVCRVATRWTPTPAARPATTRIAATQALGLRWYSLKNDPDAIPGSTEWDYEMMKSQAKGPKKNVVLVDVREPLELQETGKIPGAINIPITTAIQSFHISPEDFADMYGFERPAKDQELVFYCKAGVRAKAAAGLAQHAGWEKVGVYYGSWLDWEKEGGEVERVKIGEGPIRD